MSIYRSANQAKQAIIALGLKEGDFEITRTAGRQSRIRGDGRQPSWGFSMYGKYIGSPSTLDEMVSWAERRIKEVEAIAEAEVIAEVEVITEAELSIKELRSFIFEHANQSEALFLKIEIKPSIFVKFSGTTENLRYLLFDLQNSAGATLSAFNKVSTRPCLVCGVVFTARIAAKRCKKCGNLERVRRCNKKKLSKE